MLDLSFWEIFLVMVACIIFLKPEDIPEILKQTGKFFKKIKNLTAEIASIFDIEDKKPVYPKNKVLGLDGEYHDAYDVSEVFPKTETLDEDGKQR